MTDTKTEILYWHLTPFYSILYTILYIIIFLLVVIYSFVLININYIKQNWETEKCKSSGLLIGGKNNFNECVKHVLKDVVDKSTQPLRIGGDELNNFYNILSSQISNMLQMGNKTKSKLQEMFNICIQIISKLFTPIILFYNTINSVLLRMKAILVTQIYFLISTVLTLKQSLEVILNIIINILLMLVGLIIAMLILPFSWGVAFLFIAIFTSISIPLVAFLGIISKAANLQILKVPKAPRMKKPHICFDKHTLIPLQNEKCKYIHELEIGDILNSGSTVTSLLILDSTYAKMYYLNNILVTGSHLVKYNNTWIPVDSHPSSKYFPSYDVSNPVYCMNTSSGLIEIGNMVFTDWDEMLPNDFIPYPINTILTLHNGNTVKIQSIQIKDIIKYEHLPDLYKVTGIAKIEYNGIKYYHLYTDNIY